MSDTKIYNSLVLKIKKDISELSFFSRAGVVGGKIFNNLGEEIGRNMDAPCHGWTTNYEIHPGYFILSSLRYFAYGNGESRRELSKEYFSDLCSIPSFKSVVDKLTFIEGFKGKNSKDYTGGKEHSEDWLLIEVTKENLPFLGTFLILSRHGSEENITKIGSNNQTMNTLGLWLYLCKEKKLPFWMVYPFATKAVAKSNGLIQLNERYHSHSSFDGVPSEYPLVPKSSYSKKKIAFSRTNFSYKDDNEVNNKIKELAGKLGLKASFSAFEEGYFNNKKVYYPWLLKDFDGRAVSASRSDDTGLQFSIDQLVILIPALYKEFYGKVA